MTVLESLLGPEHSVRGRVLGVDAALTAGLAALAVPLALTGADGQPVEDAAGWLLLAGSVLPLVGRRLWPMAVLVLSVVCAGAYHALDYAHAAPVPASAIALYTVAAAGPRWRTVVVAVGVPLVILGVWAPDDDAGEVVKLLRLWGWVFAVTALGEAVRLHRSYLAAVHERAERAERTREQEAARRVAEERLRIARDLHDLLAHSITLIGVQASVAAHVVQAAPERMDRAAVAQALETIGDTCRDARTELRETLRVLRAGEPDGEPDSDGTGALPGLAGVPDLAGVAEAAGARVTVEIDAAEPPPHAVGAAAYRIVQEALTNAVRHGGSGVGVHVAIHRAAGALRVSVTDDGGRPAVPAPAASPGAPPGEAPGQGAGFGLAGMRERARSVGGTLHAVPRQDGPGFAVTADLPLPTAACPA